MVVQGVFDIFKESLVLEVLSEHIKTNPIDPLSIPLPSF